MRFFDGNVRRAGLLIGLAFGLGACGTTYGTGVNPGTQTVKDLTGMFSVGGGGKKGPPIAYGPRPPIVTPPDTATLPPPGSGETVQNWPNDPDAMARAQAFANADRQADTGDALIDPGFRLPKQKVEPYEEPSLDDTLLGLSRNQSSQRKLFAAAKGGAAGQVDAEGNPVRTALTEPPAEYRVPDPSAPEEFEEASNKKFGLFKKRRNNPRPSEMGGGTADIANPASGNETQTQEISVSP